MRQLGIPTVVDCPVQQAILQALQPILDPTFSGSRIGFRPERSAHDALAQADFLQSLGVPEWRAWILALSGMGRWRKALSYQATEALTLAWFRAQGLVPLARPVSCITSRRKPPWYLERMLGGVGGGNREEPAYPIAVHEILTSHSRDSRCFGGTFVYVLLMSWRR